MTRRNLGNLIEHLERIEQIVEPGNLSRPYGCRRCTRLARSDPNVWIPYQLNYA